METLLLVILFYCCIREYFAFMLTNGIQNGSGQFLKLNLTTNVSSKMHRCGAMPDCISAVHQQSVLPPIWL